MRSKMAHLSQQSPPHTNKSHFSQLKTTNHAPRKYNKRIEREPTQVTLNCRTDFIASRLLNCNLPYSILSNTASVTFCCEEVYKSANAPLHGLISKRCQWFGIIVQESSSMPICLPKYQTPERCFKETKSNFFLCHTLAFRMPPWSAFEYEDFCAPVCIFTER